MILHSHITMLQISTDDGVTVYNEEQIRQLAEHLVEKHGDVVEEVMREKRGL